MANVEKYDDLIIGSGIAGKFTAWTRDSRRRTVIVERGLLGGACHNVACLPSKNLICCVLVPAEAGFAEALNPIPRDKSIRCNVNRNADCGGPAQESGVERR